MLKLLYNITAVPPMIKPWGSDIFPLPNPISMMNQIGGSTYGKDKENEQDCQNQNNFVPTLLMNPMLQPAVRNDNNRCMENSGEGLNVLMFLKSIGYWRKLSKFRVSKQLCLYANRS